MVLDELMSSIQLPNLKLYQVVIRVVINSHFTAYKVTTHSSQEIIIIGKHVLPLSICQHELHPTYRYKTNNTMVSAWHKKSGWFKGQVLRFEIQVREVDYWIRGQ